MIRKLHFVLVTALLGGSLVAQTPQYLNNNNTTGANAIPFDSGAQLQWRHAQFFIPANSMGAVPSGHQITTVYFRTSTNGSVTYPNLYIRLKTGSGTGLTGVTNGPFEANMVTVFHGVNHTINTTATNWFSITLNTPFPYDPTQPLIIDIEHDHPNAAGPTVYQSTTIPGPGNGRQWGNTGGANISGVGTQQVNFGIDVVPSVPCTTAPDSNATSPLSFTTCPGITNPPVALASSYTLGGITYQWYSSTTSSVGPFSAVTGATLQSTPVPSLSSTTWYQLVATCTNVSASTTLAPSQIYVEQNVVTSTPPYYESFEGVPFPDRLPNCSWFSAELGSSAKTYTGALANNLLPNTGSKFAAFSNSPPGTSHYFTNGLNLSPGITYSASVWYQTDLSGSTNWSDLSLLIGSSQSTTGLTTVASTNGPAVSVVYKPLSGTFSVPSAGVYYLAVRATGGAGGAQDLVWDDLRVEMPCSVNTPSISILSSATDVCEGAEVILTATGADDFVWNNNAGSGNVVTVYPYSPALYTATGTNTTSGCNSSASVFINVRPVPSINVLTSPAVACAGAPLYLIASGGLTYTWSTGGNSSTILEHPQVNTTYTVVGTNVHQCQGTAVQHVTVQPLPMVVPAGPSAICVGETAMLEATGANSYTWMANSVFIIDNPVSVSPATTTNYTVVGADANGCKGLSFHAITVNACVGLPETGRLAAQVYPNPSDGHFVVEIPGRSGFHYIVSDVTGRAVARGQAEKTASLDLSGFPAGLYLVTLSSDGQSSTVRLIRN